jgi:hypothetical protein
MTHPTRNPHTPDLRDVLAKISDRDMTEMALAVNIALGPQKAWLIAELVAAARVEVAKQDNTP